MKYIVDIKGEIEGDYEIIGEYKEQPQVLVYSGAELANAILNAVDNAPTVSIDWGAVDGDRTVYVRPQGEWITKEHSIEYYCSRCGERFDQCCENFCCHCGAKMGGGAE